ncbi:MAG: flagellar motor protein MotB [Pseudomonadota bacterium]
MAESNQPNVTIIKRKKVSGGDGHHGGAWKVAYADFVTAMMAFFLLMWLLNATTESQRKGIADYFTPTIPISPVSGGGNGVLSGSSVFSSESLSQDGVGATSPVEGVEEGEKLTKADGEGDRPEEEAAPLEALATELRGRSGESDAEDDLLSHIITRVTDEGLVIDVFAKEGRPLFASGSAEPTETMDAILDMIADVIGLVSNEVAVVGHTDSSPFAGGGSDNWALSTARADASRRALDESGVDGARFRRVTGMADRELALPEAPLDPRNRRVTLVLLRSDR